MNTNGSELKEIMRRHRLSYEQVAKMLHQSKPTVISWTRPETSKAARPMPDAMLELLRYKVGEAK